MLIHIITTNKLLFVNKFKKKPPLRQGRIWDKAVFSFKMSTKSKCKGFVYIRVDWINAFWYRTNKVI